jgi:ABC-type tungstate transport system substrate-binding protein
MPAMSAELFSALSLSVQVALAATLLNALFGIPIAYVLARRRFWGHGLLDLLVTLPLVLPPTVTGYYLIVLLGRRGLLGKPIYEATGWSIAFTWYAAVVAATVMALPLLVRTARAAIESVDRDLERAAWTLGHSEWRTALEVTLPLARNGLIAGARARLRARARRVRRHPHAGRQHPRQDGDGAARDLHRGADGRAGRGPSPRGAAHRAVLRGPRRGGAPGPANDMSPRLQVCLRKRLQAFELDVEWQAGDGVAVLFGPSGAARR